MKLFETAADLGGFLFRILDNGGDSADRYTVAFSDGDCLALSGSPEHPCGVSLWSSFDPARLAEMVENGEAVDLSWGCLPEHIRAHVLFRVNEGWRDFLEDGEAGEDWAVAVSRDVAEVNEGAWQCSGKGIYRDASGYHVRLDSDPEDDRGPFPTFREALLASLADEYSLAGPEYHSTALGDGGEHTDIAHPEIMAAIAALEEKRDRAWRREA